jgi:hypothetical protein
MFMLVKYITEMGTDLVLHKITTFLYPISVICRKVLKMQSDFLSVTNSLAVHLSRQYV